MKSKKVTIVDHPLAQDKLWHLRNKETNPDNFRRLISELSHILAYEMTKDFKVQSRPVETPIAKTTGNKIVESMALVPIMRAGQAMVDGMLNLMPSSPVGHIGIYRDKFVNNTVEYYFRLPSGIEGMRVAILDPLLASGETAIAAVNRMKEYNVGPITFVSLLVSAEGLARFTKVHPDVRVFTLSVEPEVNAQGYITPGIGDAGDRIYGTFQAKVLKTGGQGGQSAKVILGNGKNKKSKVHSREIPN